MNFTEYQEKAKKTALYPREYSVIYPALGLGGEAGEVLEKIKKWIRDEGAGEMSEDRKELLKKEIGDVLWYVAAISSDLGLDMGEIAEMNIEKLYSRLERDKINGDGDER